eukprot:7111896-Pyramimonas_sp.AAC.1
MFRGPKGSSTEGDTHIFAAFTTAYGWVLRQANYVSGTLDFESFAKPKRVCAHSSVAEDEGVVDQGPSRIRPNLGVGASRKATICYAMLR